MQIKANRFVQEVFSQVPATYEWVNHILTLGFDVAWRKRAARMGALHSVATVQDTAVAAGDGSAAGARWVDMCTGTGETASYLQHLAPPGTTVYGVDFSPHMIAEATKKPEAGRIRFLLSDVKSLPFADHSLDLVTISFATRNINLRQDVLQHTFAEFYRVLRPGGCFINLETSQPTAGIVKKGFHLYVRLFVKAIGSRISGSKTAYTYLAHTIPRFYPAEELAGIIRHAGFRTVTAQRWLFGVAAVHLAIK